MADSALAELVQKMLQGDRHALARLFSALEDDPGQVPALMKVPHSRLGGAYTVGVTGPPGAGKSTLVDGMVRLLRGDGLTVGVLAVDPTSVFTGGAVLGDRIRMNQHTLDEGVFIRSLATRGAHGGLSRVAGDAVTLLDAFGKDTVLLESAGVGQTELDIMGLADTVVVVLVPEAGDAVQAMKAGLIEIADVIVVNKSDRDGADRLANTIRDEVRATRGESWWTPPVVTTRADRGEGLDTLRDAIDRHRAESETTSRLALRRSQRRRRAFLRAVSYAIEDAIDGLDMERGELGEIAARVERGETDPHSAALEAMQGGGLLARLAERQCR
jgi:LAO/AO transport system kinase